MDFFFQKNWIKNGFFGNLFLNIVAYGKRPIVPHVLTGTVTVVMRNRSEAWIIHSSGRILCGNDAFGGALNVVHFGTKCPVLTGLAF